MEFCGGLTPAEQKTDPKDYGAPHIVSEDFGKFQRVAGHAPGRLDARDPITGRRKWTYEMDIPTFGSVLVTGGGLVFNGDPRGILRAFDPDDGKVLWSFNTGSGLRSGLVTMRSTASNTFWCRADGAPMLESRFVSLTCGNQKSLRPDERSCGRDRIPPLVCRLGSEDPERRSRDEMALKVEGVVDGGVHAKKLLGGAS